jgi:signal transduction histidine kinase
MNHLRRLDVRLFLSYAVVVIVGAATLAITFSLVAPSLFDNRMMGMGPSTVAGTSGGHRAFGEALRAALPVAVLVSVSLSALVAAFVARRILRPIEAVRRATKRLADGHYDERVEEPDELELAALASDVNRLASALESTEHRRRELISEVAHEMRTPLTTIEGYVDGILDGVFEPTEEVLTGIAEETARLARLAADLGAVSLVDERALELHLAPADLGGLAARVVERLRPQFDAKHVGLEPHTETPTPVIVDHQRITQVLTNLVGNALTYTNPGGHVTVTASHTGDHVRVVVADTGIGIAAEDLARVFERFYRVADITRPPSGSGIGLTIARSLARAHDGDIHARSPGPGQGSTFTLELPTST